MLNKSKEFNEVTKKWLKNNYPNDYNKSYILS